MLVSKQSLATTRTIFAAGASACAIVTSRVLSSAQPTLPGTPPHKSALEPGGGTAKRSAIVLMGQSSLALLVHVGPQRTVTVAGRIPKAVSNVLRSAWIVGLPKESPKTIVWPA